MPTPFQFFTGESPPSADNTLVTMVPKARNEAGRIAPPAPTPTGVILINLARILRILEELAVGTHNDIAFEQFPGRKGSIEHVNHFETFDVTRVRHLRPRPAQRDDPIAMPFVFG